MKPTRMGRPRAKLPKAQANITTRVRRLLDYVHDGNVREASQASGIAYATLRDLYTGKSTNPSIGTLKVLSDAYGMYTGWFTDETQPGEVPPSGYVGKVRGFAGGKTPHLQRTAIIPFASYPLPKVVKQIDDALEKMPPSPTRPIIGEASVRHSIFAISEFVLGPLLLAEEKTGVLLIPDTEPWAKDGWEDPAKRATYVGRCKLLGRFWESVLDEVLASIHAASVSTKPGRRSTAN